MKPIPTTAKTRPSTAPSSALVPPTLQEALLAATFDQSLRPWFYRVMLCSEMFIGAIPPSLRRSGTFPVLTTMRNGTRYVAAFSETSMLPAEVTPMKTTFLDLVAMFEGVPLCLNPNQPATKEFSTDESRLIEEVLVGKDFSSVQPPPPPAPEFRSPTDKKVTDFVTILSHTLSSHPLIENAYAAEMDFSGSPAAWITASTNSDSAWETFLKDCVVLSFSVDAPPDKVSVIRHAGESLPAQFKKVPPL